MTNSKTTDFFSLPIDIKLSLMPKFTAQHSTAQHSTAQHSTAQHTARVLRFSGKLAKQAQLATSTIYNSARKINSGYTHFKQNNLFFPPCKSFRSAGQVMFCAVGFNFKYAILFGAKVLTRSLFINPNAKFTKYAIINRHQKFYIHGGLQ